MDSECGRAPNSSPQADRSGMLISPPPEEVLRLAEGRAVRTSGSGSSAVAPKRKRLPPTPVAIRDTEEHQTNITPNPRLRKQPKHGQVVLGTSKIPNVQGETQNVATSSHSGYRRRASTPIPAYDPPAEHFTPPREVVCTPPAGSRQKQRRKKRASSKPPVEEDDKSMVRNKGLHIKTEPPVIDLSAPPPPASPSDDPILLSGPPQRQSSRNPQTPSPSRRAHLVDFEMDLEIAGNETIEVNSSPERFTQPVFDFDNNMSSTWSDSDDDDVAEEAEGEYTGKFTAFKVPIKADPPTSTTSRRMHQWGRPVSPHPLRPGSRRQSQGSPQTSSARLIDDDVFTDTEDGPYASRALSLNDRQMSCSPGNEDGVDNPGDGHSVDDQHDGLNSTDVVDTTGRRAQNPFDFHSIDTPTTSTFMAGDIMLVPKETAVPFGDLNNEHTHFEEHITKTTSARHPSPFLSDVVNEETEVSHDEENPEQAFNSADFHVPGDDDNDHHATLDTPREEIDADSDGSDDSGLEVPTEAGVVKIISNDPRAAARAAAILKQNDYDMIPHLALKRRRRQSIDSALRSIRRKDASDAGVSKSTRKSITNRRSTFGGVLGGKVYIPGSPAMTLPELLHEAELEVVSSSPKKLVTTTRDDEVTPSLFSPEDDDVSPTREAESTEREWTKKDWKALDQCFSDERLAVAVQRGAAEGTFAGVYDVELGDVVRRYIETMGGESVVEGMGVEWTLDKLMHRTKALRKRQEIGKGAPPTPDALRLFCVSPTPSDMFVPHFTPTPADRRLRVPRTLGKGPLLPAPEPVTMFVNKPPLPLSLMAPRYSHLLEEALTVQNEGDRQRSASPVDSVNSADESTEVRDTTPERQLANPVRVVPEPPTSAIKRSLNYITSWLRPSPRPSKPTAKRPTHPALPIPPPEILEKPRGPVATPARKPLPRLSHPKELVTLQHAPLPPKPSQIPRVKEPPKRLVELNHIPVPPSEERPRLVSVKRKSSTGSVKDLVKNFEEMEKSVVTKGERSGVPAQLRKVKSVSALGMGAERKAPAWRP
ncbi:hypothetical protein BD410DRAFT_899871 [Rickenella mellea]|uniref:Uncharacterized protein n=1 Tax=Rickenella mellea TaxID=50990 RepID=A0A4Y7PZ44_9AGAM|nr:hypothetical protein BD410DRAFT_899871 [Rickenella mellea]